MSITVVDGHSDRASIYQQGIPPGYPPTTPPQLEAKNDEEDKIPPSLKNIPDLIQGLVIKSSSINSFTFPEGPSESLLKIMAIKKAIVARNTLTTLLQNANCQRTHRFVRSNHERGSSGSIVTATTSIQLFEHATERHNGQLKSHPNTTISYGSEFRKTDVLC